MDVVDDDALVLVLERVDSHVSLIRAAAVCKRWHSAIADAAFLRRYRSLHAPPAVGYYHNPPGLSETALLLCPCAPVFVPSPPSIVDARHFSLDFLCGGEGSWRVMDSRGSLVVLTVTGLRTAFTENVVCEPLTQRYRMIHLPPDSDGFLYLGPFLLDGEANEVGGGISMSNFRLLCLFHSNGVTCTSIFTAGSSWSEKSIDPMAPSIQHSRTLGHASGSLYFYVEGRSRTLTVLDGSNGEFSSSLLPAIENWDFHMQRYNCCVTEGCDGQPRIIVVFDNAMKVFARLDSTEWALEKKILLLEAIHSLPGYHPGHHHIIQTMGQGFIILLQGSGPAYTFSVNLETMEAAPAENNMGLRVYQCKLPWPPALHAGLDR
ncbi:unnamed protein product [Urochloa decumbens]|uniref:F-box domain-containing protein n=1 Tax=Urochloa decumbens TaxID=240449 RepID=A0ABC8VWW2_9POAL